MPFVNFKVPEAALSRAQKEEIVHRTTAMLVEYFSEAAAAHDGLDRGGQGRRLCTRRRGVRHPRRVSDKSAITQPRANRGIALSGPDPTPPSIIGLGGVALFRCPNSLTLDNEQNGTALRWPRFQGGFIIALRASTAITSIGSCARPIR